MDVCVVTTIHYPYDARIYSRELMALLDHGYSMAFVSPWDKTDRSDPRIQWIQPGSPRKRLDRILHGWRTFRAAWKVDARAYHFHDLDFLPWSLLLRFLKRVPVVYDCHENYPEEVLYNKAWIPQPLRTPLAFGVRVFENACVRLLGHVIVPVPSLMEKFGRYRVHLVQVRNLAGWKANRELSHERALIFTGGMSPSYGVEGLLEISRELKRRGRDYRLIVTDRFHPAALRESFTGAIAQEGLAIEILPKVSPDDMDKLLSRAWIGLGTEMDTPDRRLSLPTKLFEYMAMGLPVVASAIPLSRDVVLTAGCGIPVPPADWSAFVDAIERLWEDEPFRRECQERGFEAIEREFSWDLEKAKLVGFFSEIIGAPASPSPSGAGAA